MNKCVNTIIIFIFTVVFFCSPLGMDNTLAEQAYPSMIIFIIDGLSFDRFHQWMKLSPSFHMWVQQSDIGAMTMRTGSGRALHNQLVTLATGVKATAPAEIFIYEPLEETTGVQSQVFRQWIAEHKWMTFGEAVHRSGRSIEVIGNGDLWNKKRSLASVLASDQEGRVERAKIDEEDLLHPVIDHPLIMLSRYEKIKAYLAQSKADIIIVDLADLRRIDLSLRYDEEDKRYWMQQVNHMIVDLLLWTKGQFSHCSLWILSPSIDKAAEGRQEWLTPILHYSSQQRREGIFYSPTTRQPGIVANVDVMPTWLQHLGINENTVTEGRPLKTIEGKGTQEQLFERVDELFYIHHLRPDVLYQVISLQVILIIIAGVMGVFSWINKYNVESIGHYVLTYVIMVPFFLLLLGAVVPRWDLIPIHLYLICGGGIIAFLLRRLNTTILYSVIGLLYVLLLFLDGWIGNALMKRSFLGYDPIIGARYYGIGNEYMGVLIGTSILLFYLLYETLKQWKKIRIVVLITLQLSVLIYLAAPGGGTNAGGTIAWLGAILLMSRQLFPMLWRGRKMLWMIVIVMSLFFLFLLIQYLAAEQTHVGRLIHHVMEGGFAPLWEMVQRKMEMNLRLIRSSTWSKLFVTSIVIIIIFWLYPKGRQNKPASPNVWKQALRTNVWVSLINLLVNDSGVVATAGSLLFAAVPLLHLVLRDRFTTAPAPPSSSPIL